MTNSPSVPPEPPLQPGTDKAAEVTAGGTDVTGSQPPAPGTLIEPTKVGLGTSASAQSLPSIGGYSVVRKIGEGGMGAVYLAEDARLGRKIAIKAMKPELSANKSDRDRFEREARTAAAVEHDNIVPILHVGEAGDGTPFIAMPFLHGEPLDARLRREAVPNVGMILKVAREVADGLAAAHAVGLIHRDIKPANVWLEGEPGAEDPEQQFRRCKILDFGLARSAANEDTHITASGAILGTPAYMSPEQARGEKIDHRSDLFSLGVMLYRMATGTMPFRGPNTMAVLIALSTETPPPVLVLNPDLPPALAELIDRLMSKDPAARPQSAMEVAMIVRRIARELRRYAVPPPPDPTADTTSLLGRSPPVRVAPPSFVGSLEPVSESLPRALPTDETTAHASNPPPSEPKPALEKAKDRRAPWLIAAAVGLFALIAAGAWITTKNRDPVPVSAPVPGADVTPKEKSPTVRSPDTSKMSEPLPPTPTNPATPKTPTPMPPVTPEPPPDPERKAAEWVLSAKGSLRINGEGDEIKTAKALPKEAFRLTEIFFTDPIKDADLAALASCKHLTKASLLGTGITNAGLAHLKDCKELTYLDLSGTKVNDDSVDVIKSFTKLKDLLIGSTKLSERGVKEIANELPACRIQYDGGTIPPFEADRKAAEYILSVGGEVRVNGTNAPIKARAALPNEPFRLSYVDATENEKVMDAGLAVFKGCKHIAFLDLSRTKAGDVGLANFDGCTGLEKLNLIGTEVTNAGLKTFAGCKNLTNLGLSSKKVGNAGLENFTGCTKMKWINISGTAVTSAGLVHIKDCKQLETLWLSGTPITDEAVAQLKQLKALISLELGSTELKKESINELVEALPRCKINHNWGTGPIKP